MMKGRVDPNKMCELIITISDCHLGNSFSSLSAGSIRGWREDIFVVMIVDLELEIVY